MGANLATNLELQVTINHDDDVVFQESKTMPSLWQGYKDSLIMDGYFVPKEKGSYTIQYHRITRNIFPRIMKRQFPFMYLTPQITELVINRILCTSTGQARPDQDG